MPLLDMGVVNMQHKGVNKISQFFLLELFILK